MHTSQMADLLRQVSADVIEPRFRSLSSTEIHEKNPGDLVTVADREAEVRITEHLRQVCPDAIVVGEEAVAAQPVLVHEIGRHPHVFVIDPVDGTRNFVEGRRTFGVMVVEVQGLEATRSWMWQPELDRMYIGQQGAGVTCNGEPVRSPERPIALRDMTVVAARPSMEGTYGELTVGATAWSCAVDYPRLITGEADAAIYLHAWPWDHLPGLVMTRECGGVVRHFSGAPYQVGEVVRGGLLAAASQSIWDTVRAELDVVLERSGAQTGDHPAAPTSP